MMLQKNKSHAGKMKVVALSLLMVTGMIFVQCSKDTAPQSKTTTMTNAEIADKLYNGEGLKIKKLSGAPQGIGENEVPAQFEGDMMKYLGSTIVYPKAAKDKKIEGKVLLQFTIKENGEIGDITVLKSPDETLTKAAIEVVAKMPKWIPATKDGNPVKSSMILPISYKLDAPEPTEFQKTLNKSGYNMNGGLKLFPDGYKKSGDVLVVANGC